MVYIIQADLEDTTKESSKTILDMKVLLKVLQSPLNPGVEEQHTQSGLLN